jgi:hypothetical protein
LVILILSPFVASNRYKIDMGILSHLQIGNCQGKQEVYLKFCHGIMWVSERLTIYYYIIYLEFLDLKAGMCRENSVTELDTQLHFRSRWHKVLLNTPPDYSKKRKAGVAPCLLIPN